jgi:hypothetical protein
MEIYKTSRRKRPENVLLLNFRPQKSFGKRWILHPRFDLVIQFLLTSKNRPDAKNTGAKRSAAESQVLDRKSAFWLGNQIQPKLTLLHLYLITIYDHKQQLLLVYDKITILLMECKRGKICGRRISEQSYFFDLTSFGFFIFL